MKHMAKRSLAMLLALVTVLLVFPVMTSTATAAEEPASILDDTATGYDAWYVQNGLVMLLSAFDQSKAGITVTDGYFASWNNKVKGGSDATFYNYVAAEGGVAWKYRSGMGVGYDLSLTQVKSTTVGRSLRLDLGTGIVDAYADFTVEYFANLMRASENGAYLVGSGSSNYNTDVNNEKLGPWGTWQFSMETTADQSRCQYTANGAGSNYGHNDAINNFTPAGYTLNLWNKAVVNGVATQDIPKGISSVINNPTATDSSRTYYANGEYVAKFTINPSKIIKNVKTFFLMGGAGNTTYAVRVYNRALTDAERLQNHFVDIAAYVGADLSSLASMSAEARAMLFSCSRGWAVNTVTKEMVESTAEDIKNLSFEMDEYEELYVQDGLVMLLSAYDQDSSSADLKNGRWYSKKGIGFATLKGGVYAEGTNETGWVASEKGISWTQDYTKSGRGQINTGIYFSYDQLPAKDYTVQIASTQKGITDNSQPYVDKYVVHYHFETEEPQGWRTTEKPAEGSYLTLTIGGTTYYYPGTKYGTKDQYWYWGTVTQKDKNGVDTVTWHKATALNADGTVKTYYGTTSSGSMYGTYYGETVAFGYFRNMTWINHGVYKYADGYLDGKVRYTGEGSDARANRWYYTNQTYFQHSKNSDEAGIRDYLTADHSWMQTTDIDQPILTTMTHAAKASCATVGLYYGMRNAFKYDTILPAATPTSNSLYQIQGLAGDFYSVRIYSKVLSDAELARNYFVDVCAYNGLDVTGVAELIESDPDAAQAMFNAMTAYYIRDSRVEAMQGVIDAALAGISPTAAKMNAYDKLYVQEDLAALFTAFDVVGSGINLSAGTWTDKKTGASITLYDNTADVAWAIGANNQGVGYAFENFYKLDSNKYNIGMRLPTNVLTDGNLAIEYTFAITPVTDSQGNQIGVHRTDRQGVNSDGSAAYDYSQGGRWGLYNGDTTSNFSFAGLQMCMFQLSDNPEGASMRMRFFYSSKTWEKTGKTLTGASGDKRNFSDNHVFGTDAYNTAVQTMTVNRTVTDRSAEGKHTRVGFTVLLDRVSKQTVNNDVGSDFQRSFYTVADIQNDDLATATAADAFFGFPSTVYSIRIYTDTLTAAEMQQNHAVDLMAYFGLDVDGFSAADEATKTAVYEAFAAYTFEATAEEVAAMQAAINAATWGIPVAEGFQVSKDGKALRIWASVDSFEDVYRLGMTITFKQNGEVIYTGSGETITAFLSVTAGDETITAEALGAEGLYAASVTGFAEGTYTVEITPYVVYRDSTTVTGETESADITFTFAE